MLSTLFGKKASEKVQPNSPWDEVTWEGSEVTVPIWKSRTKEGWSRFVFSFSRPFTSGGEKYYARTFEVQHVRDIVGGLDKLALLLASREDVAPNDRRDWLNVHRVMENAFRAIQAPKGHFSN